jgi:cell wall-associated NlpC family hydrolase
MSLDKRRHPFRPDLAAENLRDEVEAERYVQGVRRGIVVANAPLRRLPSPDAPLDTEALFGEHVLVYEERDGWAWAQLELDGYVGYLPASALGDPVEPTHQVVTLRTHAYPGADIKLPPLRALCFSARVSVERFEGEFAIANDGAHYWARHLAPIDELEPDFVEVARRWLGLPYFWGGRSPEGFDCAGLVQTALRAAGVNAPRDSDMQEAELGEPLPPDTPRARGDFVFWRGHIGVLTDADTLLHANGFHMLVVEEPLAEACRRIETRGGGSVTSIRRGPRLSGNGAAA